jgi:NTP pyrophosphatase (non-canonical NTP hydrolase)
MGEVARELKKTWSPNYDAFDVDRLAPELADTFVLLSALATEFGVDLDSSVRVQFFAVDAERSWRKARPS